MLNPNCPLRWLDCTCTDLPAMRFDLPDVLYTVDYQVNSLP